MLDFIHQHYGQIFAILFAISELLAQIPQIESNSVFQLVMSALKWLKPDNEP